MRIVKTTTEYYYADDDDDDRDCECEDKTKMTTTGRRMMRKRARRSVMVQVGEESGLRTYE